MDIHAPPIRYPSPRLSTSEPDNNDNDNDNDSTFRASDDSTLAGSIPPSPQQPPAYGAERAPPQYQDQGEDDPDDIKARRKVRRTLCIRLMTSIFITVLVSLIVAAVVARIHDSNINTDWGSNETASNKTNGTSFTITSSNKATSAQPIMAATTAAFQDLKTAMVAHKAEPTTTSTMPTTTPTEDRAVETVDCASLGIISNVTPVTEVSPAPTKSTSKRRKRKVHQLVEEEDHLLGISVYTVDGCLLSRTSSKDSEGSLTYKCTMACPEKRWETNQARDVVADEWGACG